MAEVVVTEFSAPDAVSIYERVNKILGIGDQPAASDWPDGLTSHVAGGSGDRLLVVEVWESQAAQEAFMQSRLGPAFAEAGVPQPTRVEWFPAVGEMQR